MDPLSDLPMGLGMALAQNVTAMQYFSNMSPEEQRKIIDHTHAIKSKSEMHAYVSQLGSNGTDVAAPESTQM